MNNRVMKTEILVFRTSIKFKKDLKSISNYLNVHNQIINWNVDFEDWEKILRIETTTDLLIPDLISTLNKMGFICEELED